MIGKKKCERFFRGMIPFFAGLSKKFGWRVELMLIALGLYHHHMYIYYLMGSIWSIDK